MTQEAIHTFTGKCNQTDTAHGRSGKGPYRFSLQDQNNQSFWFSTFDKTHEAMIEKLGVNGVWTITYSIKEWTGTDGNVRHTNECKTVSSVGAAPAAPAPAPAPAPLAPAPTPAPASSPIVNAATDLGAQETIYVHQAAVEDAIMGHWADNMDDRGRSIIRQVAFKDVPNKDDKTPEQIWNLTNIYEDILLGRFIPESNGNIPNPAPPSDGSFVQQEF